jgi:hypothetical protein
MSSSTSAIRVRKTSRICLFPGLSGSYPRNEESRRSRPGFFMTRAARNETPDCFGESLDRVHRLEPRSHHYHRHLRLLPEQPKILSVFQTIDSKNHWTDATMSRCIQNTRSRLLPFPVATSPKWCVERGLGAFPRVCFRGLGIPNLKPLPPHLPPTLHLSPGPITSSALSSFR